MSKFNKEGYYDPTAHQAIANVTRPNFRPLVYICSPYAGDVDTNVDNARRYSRFSVVNGMIPIAPHLLFPQFMDDDNEKERELAMFMNMILLDKCQELWVFGDIISKGMAQEIERAKKRKMIIRHINTEGI